MSRVCLGLLILVACCSGVLFSQEDEDPTPEPPTYSAPDGALFSLDDVRIPRLPVSGVDETETESFDISAVLRTPTTEPPAGGFPAVLFISGSGSQTKHGFQGPLTIGGQVGVTVDLGSWELLDAIANAGFSTLSFDDRGAGDTPEGPEKALGMKTGFHVLNADAQAVLDYLKQRPGINAKRIFLIGHSEGGMTAPLLAASNDQIAGIVFMAAPGRNVYDVVLEQIANDLTNETPARRETTLAIQRELMDAIKEDREPDFNVGGKRNAKSAKAGWEDVRPLRKRWHDHFQLDVPAVHAGVACPCFVAQGAKDFQVSPEKDPKQLVINLLKGQCADLTYKVYPDLDHMFKPCGGSKSTLEMYLEVRRVDEGFIQDVVGWLTSHAR